MKWGKEKWKICCYSIDSTKEYMSHGECDNSRHQHSVIEQKVQEDLIAVALELEDNATPKPEKNPELREVLKHLIAKMDSKLSRLYELFSEAENDILYRTIQSNVKKLEQLKKEYASLPKTSTHGIYT